MKIKVKSVKVWGYVRSDGTVVNVFPPDVPRNQIMHDKRWCKDHDLTCVRLLVSKP